MQKYKKSTKNEKITELIKYLATDAATLEPNIIAFAIGVRAIYELPEDRRIGCNWISGTRCPLDQGEFATYELVMPITDEYPLVTVDIEVRLYDQSRQIQFCALIEGEVVDN